MRLGRSASQAAAAAFEHALAALQQLPETRLSMQDAVDLHQSLFHGARSRDAKVIKALGVEVFEFVGGRIKEVRDYHRLVE